MDIMNEKQYLIAHRKFWVDNGGDATLNVSIIGIENDFPSAVYFLMAAVKNEAIQKNVDPNSMTAFQIQDADLAVRIYTPINQDASKLCENNFIIYDIDSCGNEAEIVQKFVKTSAFRDTKVIRDDD